MLPISLYNTSVATHNDVFKLLYSGLGLLSVSLEILRWNIVKIGQKFVKVLLKHQLSCFLARCTLRGVHYITRGRLRLFVNSQLAALIRHTIYIYIRCVSKNAPNLKRYVPFQSWCVYWDTVFSYNNFSCLPVNRHVFSRISRIFWLTFGKILNTIQTRCSFWNVCITDKPIKRSICKP